MRRAALVFLFALALASQARAAAPVVLGDGRSAGVTLDGAGTAYVAWIGHGQDPTPLFFCRLPRGASACDVNEQLAVPGTSLTRPYVVVDDGVVHVFSFRYGMSEPSSAVVRVTSRDMGATFDEASFVGTVDFYDAIRGPGAAVSLIADKSSLFQSMPLFSSGQETATADLFGPERPYAPSVAMIDATQVLAVSTAGDGNAAFRRFPGTGTPNDPGSWTPAVQFAAHAGYPRLASGPAGVFVASDDAAGDLEVRRFRSDLSGFDAPVPIPGPARELTGGSFDLVQDPGGRLHLVWPQGDARGSHVGHAVSDDGVAWRASVFDVGDPADLAQTAHAMRAAVGADHVGVMVWDNGGAGKVRAAAIGPEPPAAPVAPPQPPIPPPTVEPAPTPELGKRVTGARVRGSVRIKRPGARSFGPLDESEAIPVGSTIDVSSGRIRLTSASGAGPGMTQTAEFYRGVFRVEQRATPAATTDLVLAGGSFRACPKRRRASASATRKVRRLWGSGKGRFRTRGRHAAATVRGTTWLVEDRCDGTLVQVRQGRVRVRDNARRRSFTLRAPGKRLVRPRSPRSRR